MRVSLQKPDAQPNLCSFSTIYQLQLPLLLLITSRGNCSVSSSKHFILSMQESHFWDTLSVCYTPMHAPPNGTNAQLIISLGRQTIQVELKHLIDFHQQHTEGKLNYYIIIRSHGIFKDQIWRQEPCKQFRSWKFQFFFLVGGKCREAIMPPNTFLPSPAIPGFTPQKEVLDNTQATAFKAKQLL